jgi:hypothetical protein
LFAADEFLEDNKENIMLNNAKDCFSFLIKKINTRLEKILEQNSNLLSKQEADNPHHSSTQKAEKIQSSIHDFSEEE